MHKVFCIVSSFSKLNALFIEMTCSIAHNERKVEIYIFKIIFKYNYFVLSIEKKTHLKRIHSFIFFFWWVSTYYIFFYCKCGWLGKRLWNRSSTYFSQYFIATSKEIRHCIPCFYQSIRLFRIPKIYPWW